MLHDELQENLALSKLFCSSLFLEKKIKKTKAGHGEAQELSLAS